MFSHFDDILRYHSSTKVKPITLAATPPHLLDCFHLLNAAGAEHYALFGGAVRDADYAARHGQVRPIKDYDWRIWLPRHNYAAKEIEFLAKLTKITGAVIRTEPCPGTDKVHYCFNYNGIELDISLRPIPAMYNDRPPVSAVAIHRAEDSDIAISAVAIDGLERAWAKPEYLEDQLNKTLTVYSNANTQRLQSYAERMQKKFPDHKVVWLEQSQDEKVEIKLR